MNKPSKCKNCQWYGKPYWSIINPCDSCPNENDYKTVIQVDGIPVIKETLTDEEIKKAMTEEPEIFTRWADPTIYEKDKEIERLNNIINKIKEIIDNYFIYDYKNESMARLDAINEINHIIVKLKEGENNVKD